MYLMNNTNPTSEQEVIMKRISDSLLEVLESKPIFPMEHIIEDNEEYIDKVTLEKMEGTTLVCSWIREYKTPIHYVEMTLQVD